jgi:hypothetical protein
LVEIAGTTSDNMIFTLPMLCEASDGRLC